MQDRDGSLGSKVIVFRVAHGSYGLPLEWVKGVRESSGGEERKGKGRRIEYRGRKVPVLDLAEWFGREPEENGPTSLLIMGKGGNLAAAGVDSPGKVETVQALEEWPSLFRPLVKGMFTGLMVGEEGLVLMVDPEGVMEEVSRGGSESPKEAEGNDQNIVG